MDFLANHDPLTGAFTRSRLEEELLAFIGDSAANRQPLTMILLDLDRFKNINETLGHAAGDLLLSEVAKRMNEFGLYSVARLGADRFAAAKPGLMTYEEVDAFSDELISIMTRPTSLMGTEPDWCQHRNDGYEQFRVHT